MSFIGGTQVARMGKATSWRERDGKGRKQVTTRTFIGRAEMSRRAKAANAQARKDRATAAVVAAVTSAA